MDIPPVIVSEFGSDYVKMSSTDEIIYRCPFCFKLRGDYDKKGHLYIHMKKLVYFCHRCGARGSLISKEFDSDTILETREKFEDLLLSFVNKDVKECRYPYYIPSLYPYFSELAHSYLVSRGVTNDLQRFYDIRIGAIASDMFGRIIIPNIVHKTNYTDIYVGRSYVGHGKYKYKMPVNAPRGKAVFNLHRIKLGSPIIITEGVFSAISAGKNAVATYGKYVSDYQMKLILGNKPSTVFVCLDTDAFDTATKLCDRILSQSRVEVRLVELPEDQDPSDLGHEKFLDYLSNSKPYSKLGVMLSKFKKIV